MATVPSASASTPHSPKNQVEAASNTNGVFNVDDRKPDFRDALDHLDSTHCIERFRKYDAEYAQRLMAKYFSTKSHCGGNIFDDQITIDHEIIKSSRLPCFRFYVDSVVGSEDQRSNGSTPPADSHGNISNGKHMVKKNLKGLHAHLHAATLDICGTWSTAEARTCPSPSLATYPNPIPKFRLMDASIATQLNSSSPKPTLHSIPIHETLLHFFYTVSSMPLRTGPAADTPISRCKSYSAIHQNPEWCYLESRDNGDANQTNQA
ncbi:hypothetical protein RJT34_12418 [Clitoria ternatea]|uniref:Uncharacterized protein n=1 Tax=Clitoria ternatea TaxID=43366 RepID=A0AAN9JPG8_CLITE